MNPTTSIPARQAPLVRTKIYNTSTTAIPFFTTVYVCIHRLASILWRNGAVFLFRCCSWRHGGSWCSGWIRRREFKRISVALALFPEWIFFTLTVRWNGRTSISAGYRRMRRRWDAFRRAVAHRYGRIEYLRVWHEHRSGHPHLHGAFSNARIALLLADPEVLPVLLHDLRAMALRRKFGWRSRIERAMNLGEIATYLARVRRDQIPFRLPPKWRRIVGSECLEKAEYTRARRGMVVEIPHLKLIAMEPEARRRLWLEEHERRKAAAASRCGRRGDRLSALGGVLGDSAHRLCPPIRGPPDDPIRAARWQAEAPLWGKAESAARAAQDQQQ